jgi:hypothetical protein
VSLEEVFLSVITEDIETPPAAEGAPEGGAVL